MEGENPSIWGQGVHHPITSKIKRALKKEKHSNLYKDRSQKKPLKAGRQRPFVIIIIKTETMTCTTFT